MTETNEDVVRFTAKELLARLDVKLDELARKLDERVAYVEGRMSAIEKTTLLNTEFKALQSKTNDDVEGRIRWLEKKVWVASGFAAAGGGGLAAILNLLVGG